VHHATILEMNVESYRRKAALNASAAPVIERQTAQPTGPLQGPRRLLP